MASRRERFRDYYLSAPSLRKQMPPLYQNAIDHVKLSGIPHDAAHRYRFRGASEDPGIVVRLDLNGYSSWARGRPLYERAAQLDAFFSGVVPALDGLGGVFFRDEGDCIVCLFSSYFTPQLDTTVVGHFCRYVIGKKYGELSAKGSISAGTVAIFQKAHERESEDWSAEGEPFVRAARLEQGVQSGQRVHYFADDYRRLFDTGQRAASGTVYTWEISEESQRIPGLGNVGGWVDLTLETYIEGGRRAA